MFSKHAGYGQGDGRAPESALQGSLREYRVLPGTDLLGRVDPFYAWQDLRRRHDLWPYAKSTATAPMTVCTAMTDSGKAFTGVNFASQDYLSLSSHPAVKQAAMRAIEEYGVHSAGSAALLGNTQAFARAGARIAAFLHGRQIVLYPTGWSAGLCCRAGLRAARGPCRDGRARPLLPAGRRPRRHPEHPLPRPSQHRRAGSAAAEASAPPTP